MSTLPIPRTRKQLADDLTKVFKALDDLIRDRPAIIAATRTAYGCSESEAESHYFTKKDEIIASGDAIAKEIRELA